MAMIKKSISVTGKQDEWIKAQIATGHFGNESEVIRELIRERQLQEEEYSTQIKAMRTQLTKDKKSSFTDQILIQS